MSTKSKGSPSKRRHVSRAESSAEKDVIVKSDDSKDDQHSGSATGDVGVGQSLQKQSASPKRRKVPSLNTAPDLSVESNAPVVSAPSADEINSIIANLALPDPNIQVAIDHANHKTSNTEVQAYAKLAGANWTYYVQSLRVIIGRSSEPSTSTSGDQNGAEQVQIDLGPAKVVSRRHASIQYNQDGRYWELTILGRNGARIDKVSHKEGTTRLFSGNIIDIGGVQMMFVLPDVEPRVASSFLNAARRFSPRVNNVVPSQQASSQSSEAAAAAAAAAGLVSLSPGRNQQGVHKFENSTGPSNEQKQDYVAAATLAGAAAYASSVNGQGGAGAYANNAAYPRGVAMITRPQVRGVLQTSHYVDQDLSADDAKDIKPPYSYATMITQAIMSSEEMMLSLADIYEWIMHRYSFYRHSKSGWQNSIRHNLSLNKAFEKVPRKANEAGKGMKWQINDQYKVEYMQKANLSKPGRMRLSPMAKQQIQFPQHPQQQQQQQPPPPPMLQHQHPQQPPLQQQHQQPPPLALQQLQNHTSQPPSVQLNPIQNLPPGVPGTQQVQPPSLAHNNSTLPPPIPTGGYQTLPPLNMSPFPMLQPRNDKEDSKLDAGFVTPQKPKTTVDVPYSDQYGLATTPGNNDNNNNNTSGSVANTSPTLLPSPQRGYMGSSTAATGQISQLEAYTPERGSRGGSMGHQSKPSSNGSVIGDTNASGPGAETGESGSGINATGDSGANNAGSGGDGSGIAGSSANSAATVGASSTGTGTSSSNGNSSGQQQLNPPTPFGQFVGMTPARQTSQLQLAPPSSAQQQQLPSSFMPGSSPAPFWKMTQFSSTPIRSSEFSPSKFSSPPVSSQIERRNDGSDDTIGDLQDVDLTRYGKKKQQLW
ncbi:forkhead family transcription factor FKH2 [Sugiyamaella lignohabitans]|uniref:Forkhead family transcription factor FKH2 n=1 Tax=Sugiyamaella lignohabitans TaxID=796027 RepID=A0A167DJ16_9ASCO|nr:forkhead family transcription factor FKH2 [Sugiyamaella lignohabitans]ANB12972.1 forkhead family transcription factor FKH2 [Sugiyamaella lignohabitans]